MDNINEKDERKTTIKMNFQKRNSEPYNKIFEIGNINFDTPFTFFLKTYYNKSIESYVMHKEITVENSTQRNFIFIMQQDILLTSQIEDERNSFNYTYSNPIFMKIDYKSVIN